MIVKKELSFDKINPGKWIVPWWFRAGVSLIEGPQATGKTSLAVRLAVNNAQGLPLWEGGPLGDKRPSFFYNKHEAFDKPRIWQKIVSMGGKKKQVEIALNDDRLIWDRLQGIRKKADQLKLFKQSQDFKPIDLLALVEEFNPAFIFFNFIKQVGTKYTLRSVRRLCENFKNADTALVGFALNAPTIDLRGVLPIMSLRRKDNNIYLGKKSGFPFSPRGLLKFHFEPLPIPQKQVEGKGKSVVCACH